MTTAEEIVKLYHERSQAQSGSLAKMYELVQAYEGTISVPLPEMDRNERVAIANFVEVALDQMGMRISSIVPDVYFPPTQPGQPLAEKNASLSRKATLAWWDKSQMEIKLARRARWLIGFGCAPVVLRWDEDCGCPRWELRDPMGTFPARSDDPDDMCPPDVIFMFRRPLVWLREHYPSEAMQLSKGANSRPDTEFDILEYDSGEERVQVVVGKAVDRSRPGVFGTSPFVELERQPNRAGCCPFFIPGRVTLGRRQGAYDGTIGIYQRLAMLQALEVIAVTRGVFANEWLVARPNEQARVVVQANGRRGITGVIEGGELQSLPQQPGYKTDQTVSALERYLRIDGGLPAEMTGESTTNVRTGRRGDAILSATVDFPVAEAQKVLARSMEYENRAAIDLAKAYAGGRSFSFYISSKGAKGRVDYVPDKNFPSSTNQVTWPAQGTDAQALIVGIGQRLGIGEMSKRTARIMDPWIEDPEGEDGFVIGEHLQDALLNGIAQQVQAGQLGPADVARIAVEVETGRSSLADAVLKVQEQKQTEQATSGAPGTPAGPLPPGSPESQPGLSGPGAPPQAGVIGPQPSQQGLAQLLGALKSGAAPPVPTGASAA